jgi:nucleotide-binding universal stress UspA family protein
MLEASPELTRILVAYDGSPAAQRALDRARAVAGPLATVTVVNVLAPPPLSARLDYAQEARQAQQEVLDEAEQWLRRHGVEAARLTAAGSPAREILAAAVTTGAELVVVGRGRGRTPHLGSISGELVRRAGCDVLVVHPGDGPPAAAA